MLVTCDKARDVVDLALAGAGVPRANAILQRDLLLEAELRGVPSHGLLRLPRVIERIANGVADPRTHGTQRWRSDCFLSVDGEGGLGPVVAMRAVERVSERARKSGIAVAAIANSNHIGMLAFYAERVALTGQTLIALSTSEALVHPWGGRRALIGTNPIAIGVPTETGPFVVDTATSIVSMGEIHDCARRGVPIPGNWALDAAGYPTTDAAAAKAGALAPFGEAKGYALGLAFELLVSSLAGSALGAEVRGTLDSTAQCNKGDLFVVIDGPTVTLGPYLDQIRNAAPAEGFERVRIPGEGGRAIRAARLRDGLPIDDGLWAELLELTMSPRRVA